MYLTDIVEAADHFAAADAENFLDSELRRSAVVQKLSVIGEAASRLRDDVRTAHLEVPWPQIIACRNILVHAYFGIDWDIVWAAATERCPARRRQIAEILAEIDDPAV